MAMEAELADLCERVAAARGAGHPLWIRGGGTRLFYGEPLPATEPCHWLDMSAYRGIVAYEPSELVLTARAGTPLAEIEPLLAEHGQMLAFEPPCFDPAGTLGGCVATGMSGPRRMAAGAASDFVLGTRLLDASGNVLHFGGEVMKNVAGFDVSRLLTGSLGVLGALLEVSLKVMPRPRCETTRVLSCDERAALQRCLAWRARALPVSATAWLPDPHDKRGRLWVRLSGNEPAVRKGGAEIGGDAPGDPVADAFWTSLRNQTHAVFRQRPLWRVSLPPQAEPLDAAATPLLHEWGGTLRWLAAPQDAAQLRARVAAMGGSACLYRRDAGNHDVATFHPLAPALLRLHQRLKQQFDPAGLFNPRRLLREC